MQNTNDIIIGIVITHFLIINISIQINITCNHTLKLGPTIRTPDDAVADGAAEEFGPRAFVIANDCTATCELLPEVYKMRCTRSILSNTISKIFHSFCPYDRLNTLCKALYYLVMSERTKLGRIYSCKSYKKSTCCRILIF